MVVDLITNMTMAIPVMLHIIIGEVGCTPH